ncbi:MAG: Co2+/Mg2+ efflux protein ApaG [Bacteroidota bacterium]
MLINYTFTVLLESKLHNIEVSVETCYIPEQSNALVNEFVFAYTITITNKTNAIVQLMRRHWIINDSNGELREVKGEGVVGVQPILEPNESYKYTSGCCLRTELGKMLGSYEFVNMETRQQVVVPIPEFQLVAPFKLN